MIDTLKISLVDYHIEPRNNVIVQPSPYKVATGELVSNFALWTNEDTGEIVQGSKAYYNDNKINVSLSPRGEITLCHVQLSLPKYHHGNNYFPVDKEAALEVFSNLEKHLKDIGVRTNISQAHISRIDLAKTIVTEESFRDYRGVFNLLKAKRTNMRDYGTTFLWYNGERELCVYDKVEEMRLSGEDVSKYPDKSMRFEYRLKKPRKIRKVLSYDTVGELKKDYGRIQEVYDSSIRNDLFKYEMKDIEVLCGNEIERGLQFFKSFGGRYYRDKYLRAVGLLKLLELAEYETIQEAFCNVVGNRMSKTRIIRELDELRAHGALLTREPNSIKTYAVLYEEMKEKVLLVA